MELPGTREGSPLDGRPHRDGAQGVVLAVDFGGSKIAACVATTDGDRLAGEVVETDPASGAKATFERGAHLAERLTAGRHVLAVGACTFGVPGDGGTTLAPAIEGWSDLRLRVLLEERFGAPASVENDVKAAARAEARRGALVGCDPGLYVNLGTGIGAALVVGGRVVVGAHGAAGEIGYARLRPASAAMGPQVLEDVASGMGLARSLAARSGDGGGRTAEDAGRVASLFESSEPGEAGAAVLDAFLEELSFHLVNLAVALDPRRVAVGGGLVRGWGRMEGTLRRALDEQVPFPPELVVGAFPFDGPLRGAVDLGVELALRAGSDGAVGGDELLPVTSGGAGTT